ncbi:MAG: SpoIIE family protein phosphatase [Luteibaculaceae bacterium]
MASAPLKLNEQLALSEEKLEILLQLSEFILEKRELNEIFDALFNFLSKTLKIKVFLMAIKDEKRPFTAVASFGITLLPEQYSAMLYKFSESGEVYGLTAEEKRLFSGLEIAIPIAKTKKNKLSGIILIGEEDKNKKPLKTTSTIQHYAFLQTLANLAILAKENELIQKINAKLAEQKASLALAKSIQTNLVPGSEAYSNSFKHAIFYQAHKELGGDYCDIIPLPNHQFAFVIADVSGKGVAASLNMVSFRAHLRTALKNATKPIQEMPSILAYCSSEIIHETKFEFYITCCVAIFNEKTKEICIFNCGHTPALVKLGSTVHQIPAITPALGMLQNLNFTAEPFRITQSEVLSLVLYSDGITDVFDNTNQTVTYGHEKAAEVLHHTPHDADKILVELISDVLAFQPNESYFTDDISLLCVTFT